MTETADTRANVLRGRYELLETLGAGGEARVVKALDHQHGRFVALKMRPVTGEQTREDLLREARVLLSLPPHASLPLVREDFFEGDEYVVAMDWVDGTDLARLLAESRPPLRPGLVAASVLAYLAEAAEALTFLHGNAPPVIHGDVKPANLILTRGGRVKLVDFGLSSTPDRAGRRQGTPGYRAPELAAGAPPSRATDVYALAATAFALLTGAPPADGSASPLAWGELAAPGAARLRAALEAGLAADPAARPASAGELVERLRAGWASTLPTGVMTFCMSDIEGSTRLWELRPEVMADAIVRHDELIADVVEYHGGRFVKSMGEGDSTASVFTSAVQAVRAAVDAALALAAEPWPEGAPIRARFGLHTGEAQRRGTVYVGTTVNLAARVRGEADGGEILLSETTAELVSGELPVGYQVVDLGPHRLKGIERPEPIKAVAGPGLETAPAAGECPYRGLLAFEADDRHLFFGREQVVGDVLARTASVRLLAVVGASGSGKSSLLRAGLLAAVQAGELPGVCSGRLLNLGPEPPLDLDGEELLVVDQFEELYTQCHDAERRAAFVRGLLSRSGPVAIGVRADFYGELTGDPELAEAVAQNQVLLGPMRADDLRRAIAEPAQLAGLRLEPGLIDLVLRDVAGEPGALPLMSHALRETWERRDGRTLTVAAYEATGGVSSAVAQTADAVADGTPEPDRPLLRNVFLRLTELGGDAEDTRRRVPIDELVPQGASSESVRTLLERLSDARLVTLDEGTAEVAHEVLIRRWPTLRRWLEEDREGLRLHRRLSDAARLWDAAGREPADLYRGTRLDAAVEWSRATDAPLNAVELDFLEGSVVEARGVQDRQLAANLRLRRALGASGVLLAAMLGLLAFALVSRHQAVRAEGSARSQAIAAAAEGQVARDPQRALLLARAALEVAPTAAADLAASEALDANTMRSQLPSFGVQACETSNYMYLLDRGRVAVDNTCDGRVVFGDLVHRTLRSVRIGAKSTEMMLMPGGRTLLVVSGRNLLSLGVHASRVSHLWTSPFPIEYAAVSPSGRRMTITDGRRLALVDFATRRVRKIAVADASVNGIIDLGWAGPDKVLVGTSGQVQGLGTVPAGLSTINLRTGSWHRTPLPVPSGDVPVLSFFNIAPDRGRWFITGTEISPSTGSQTAVTWGVNAHTERVEWIALGPVGGTADPVAPSPDGRLVGVGYSQGQIDVLDAATGRLVVSDASSSSIVAGWLQFPPGDSSLVTVTLDGVFRTWAARGSEQLRLQAPDDPVLGFTPDSRRVVLVGNRGELVNRVSGRVVGRFPGFPAASVFGFCTAACFAADPSLRWLTYLDPRSPTPRVVELDGLTGRFVAAVRVPQLEAQGVAPDGRIVAAWADGERLDASLIDPRTGARRALQPGATADGCAPTTPSFTRDSRLMAIVDGCTHVIVWSLLSGRVVRTVELPDRPNASGAAAGGTTASGAHLGPDGRYVMVTVEGGGLLRADLLTGRVAEVPGSQTIAKALAVSPNGRWYAVGRQDGTVDEYDARTMQLVRHHMLANAVQALAFSPDSAWLAVEDSGHVVRVWDTCNICENPVRLATLASRESHRSLTRGERATFGVS